MTLSDIAPIALTMPLIVSLVLTIWSRFWFGEISGPVSERTHLVLVVVQAVCVGAAFLMPGVVTMIALAFLYLAMGLGGTVLIRRGRATSCGCWGRSEKSLSWQLIAMNFLLAVGALGATQLTYSEGALQRLGVLGSLILMTYFIGVTFVEWRHSYPVMVERANLYRAQVFGFRDLESKT